MGNTSRSPKWTAKEVAIVRGNINRMTYRELAALLPGRTVQAIKLRATLNGIPRMGRIGPVARRCLNETYFWERTLQSAYWAGLLAADGCIVRSETKSVRREVRLGLHTKDHETLKRFVDDIAYDGPIKHRANMCHVVICSADQWLRDLGEIYNLTPRKTMTLGPPNVDGEAALAYSIGYIDGDGCWAINARRYNQKMLIVVGTKQLLEWMRELWKASGASVGNTKLSWSRNVWRLGIYSSHADSVARLLGDVPVERMGRKWRVARGETFGQERRIQECRSQSV